MESFLGLFDPGEEGKKAEEEWNNKYPDKELSDQDSSGVDDDNEDCLPPEPEQGNIEYKLKLVSPSSQRFEHLVTQMKWRLREGHGEAIYQIGKLLSASYQIFLIHAEQTLFNKAKK